MNILPSQTQHSLSSETVAPIIHIDKTILHIDKAILSNDEFIPTSFNPFKYKIANRITIKVDEGDFILMIKSKLRMCVECGRKTPYVINNHRPYSWRLCAYHLPERAKDIIKSYY